MAAPPPPRDRRRGPPGPRPGRGPGAGASAPRGSERGYLYLPDYLRADDRAELLAWLGTLRPLWEQRYSTRRSPPAGKQQRPLLRPVYWLGNWQFACLGYYEPPRRTRDCAVEAEPFPPVLARLIADIEPRVRRCCAAADVPRGWRLNTCLVNFYGDRRDGARWVDVARVGDHRDFEPGPVASLSIGERALFQFVRRGAAGQPPVRGQWLDDGSLQAFAGPWWKDQLLHRVQRVDDKLRLDLPPAIDGFRTRRINLTFRYVPPADVVPLAALGQQAYDDVRDYVATLAASSPHFAAALAAPRRPAAVTGTPAPRPPPSRRTSWSGTKRR